MYFLLSWIYNSTFIIHCVWDMRLRCSRDIIDLLRNILLWFSHSISSIWTSIWNSWVITQVSMVILKSEKTELCFPTPNSLVEFIYFVQCGKWYMQYTYKFYICSDQKSIRVFLRLLQVGYYKNMRMHSRLQRDARKWLAFKVALLSHG